MINNMKLENIIKAMCYNGSTEQMGVFEPTSADENEVIEMVFGSGYVIEKGCSLFSNLSYLYSYNEPLKDVTADMILVNQDNEYVYIYELL